jgi:crossover junction endodeoxyribonuclease RuvC
MTPPVVIGIDPGLDGAITAIDNATGNPIWIEPMPTTGDGKDRLVSAAHLADLLEPELIVTCCIETASTRPGLAAQSVLKTGTGYGILIGVCAALRIPTIYVSPQRWKKDLAVPADKAIARRLATERFPAWSSSFKLVKDDGKAESALVAYWAWQRQR